MEREIRVFVYREKNINVPILIGANELLSSLPRKIVEYKHLSSVFCPYLDYDFFRVLKDGSEEKVSPETPITELENEIIHLYAMHITNRYSVDDKSYFDDTSFFEHRLLSKDSFQSGHNEFSKLMKESDTLFNINETQRAFFKQSFYEAKDLNEREVGSFLRTLISFPLITGRLDGTTKETKASGLIEDKENLFPEERKGSEKKQINKRFNKKLRELLEALPNNSLFFSEEVILNYSDNKSIRVDHIIFNGFSAHLFCEDKLDQADIGGAIFQNFDQMRTYSLIFNLDPDTYLFGIVSNLEKWVFTCYRVPTYHPSNSNFFRTETFEMKPEELNKFCNFVFVLLFRQKELIENFKNYEKKPSTDRL